MFNDLFGPDERVREAITQICGNMFGICSLLIEKGIFTENELNRAMTLGNQRIEQATAQMRDDALKQLKAEDPKRYESLQMMYKLFGIGEPLPDDPGPPKD